ncbi:MAG: RNA methyltransferase [Treponema sp.]|uniref:RNA methyltransferase n=1 Tax=Treponema sp. TaxID=166 RepID=UPI0025EA36EE|nr:RNA methyltransferase [Treponema sp.]MBQ9624112.1 RNA methyltransferase [Treponema sp.]MBR0495821.1 RNA methyltransferase [Treponema sp.]
MNLSNVVVILSRPEESRNVGAVCRAMANNSLKTLRIVGKKSDFDEERVRILAIHAASIWENAQFFDSITEAAKDCTIIAGTTRRRGKKRGKLLLPEEFADTADQISSDGKIAIVFGNERTGLEEEELDECTMGVTIPSSEEFGSLNLSHAVQIISYQIFRKSLEGKNKASRGYTPVSLERLGKTVTEIADNLQKIGFFKVTGRPDMEKFWTDILSRAALSESEAQYIEKIFDKAAGLASKH